MRYRILFVIVTGLLIASLGLRGAAMQTSYTFGTATIANLTVTGTCTGCGAAASDVNVIEFAGDAVVTGTGASGLGIPRVTVANDSSIIIGTFPDNEPFNLNQFAGNAVVTGTGASGLGIPRVTVANDSSIIVGTFPDNEPFNLNQIVGTTVSVNNGTAGAGVQRVTLASDSTGNIATIGTSVTPGTAAANLGKAEDAASASGDTGVAVLGVRKDTNATLTSGDGDYVIQAHDNYGVQSVSGRHPNAIRCFVSNSTATTLQAVGGSCVAPGAGLSIYVTDIQFGASVNGGTGADTQPTLKYGTGGTCGTGTTTWWATMSASTSAPGLGAPVNLSTPVKIPANNEICWIMSTAGTKVVFISGFIAP